MREFRSVEKRASATEKILRASDVILRGIKSRSDRGQKRSRVIKKRSRVTDRDQDQESNRE